MKIYESLKQVDYWIDFNERIIKEYPECQQYKDHLSNLKQKRCDIANEIGRNVSKNRRRFFKRST